MSSIVGRSPDDFVFADETGLMGRRHRDLRCHFVCTRAEADTSWSGIVGRISHDLPAGLVSDFARRNLCGPAGFMDAARHVLKQAGCDMDCLHLEILGGVPRRNAQAAEPQAGKTAKVVFSASNIEVDCTSSHYVSI